MLIHYYIYLKGDLSFQVNLIYHFSPFALRLARKHGLGGKDTKNYPELADFPPKWMTAKDHFIVKFRKLK